ncbi:MAG TPA: hypothetical protein PKN36_09000 [bacterium]|nr:hypothetical protein [bacterium]
MKMKNANLLLMIVLTLALFSSCKGKKGEPEPGDLTPVNAAGKYGDVMVKTKKEAESINAVLPLKQLVDSYWAEEGKYPASLQNLVTSGYVKKLPDPPEGTEYDYDPLSGSVGLKNTEPPK